MTHLEKITIWDVIGEFCENKFGTLKNKKISAAVVAILDI